jgi:hypothetical protein
LELITKRQARVILDIGMSTLGLWVRQGKLKVQKREEGKFGAIYFDRAEVLALRDSRLPKAEPVVLPEPASYSDARPPVPEPDLPGFTNDGEKNQQAWHEGKVADSFGNKAYGNERPDGSISDPRSAIHGNPMIVECQMPPRCATTEHMDPALVGDVSVPSANDSYLNSPEYALKTERINQTMYDNLTKGVSRPVADQRRKQIQDRLAIASAFRFGYSR